MIILDTNVISELMHPEPDVRVVSWLAQQKARILATTALSIAEINHGLCRLPNGKRRKGLEERFQQFSAAAFGARVFSFDEASAYHYGELAAKREKAGFQPDYLDLMIAAICLSLEATLATRNVKDFTGCGLEVINPWK